MISNLIRFLYAFVFSISAFGTSIENDEIQLTPIITGFSPTEYCINNPTNITITGTNLASVTTVSIGGTNVSFNVVSDTSIVITSIPMITSSGRIRVFYDDNSNDTTNSI